MVQFSHSVMSPQTLSFSLVTLCDPPLLRNLYAGQEATVRTGHGTTAWLQVGKGGRQSCIQLVKNPPAMQETWVWSLGWEDPLEQGRLPTPVFLPGEFHGLGGNVWHDSHTSDMGWQRVGHDWATFTSLQGYKGGFSGGSSGKEPACQCRRRKGHRFYPWVGKIPWSRKWQPVTVFLPG